MSVLICGSLAFDTITDFPGRFAQQILPEQVHILNVSFLVPTLRREFGGCAGNIAYTLKHLGGTPLVKAALGTDGQDYLARLRGWGLDTSLVHVAADSYTAQAIIITDTDNNQITAFHPGAMQFAHATSVPSDKGIRTGDHRSRRPRSDAAKRAATARPGHPVRVRPRTAVADVRRRRAAPPRRPGELDRTQRL